MRTRLTVLVVILTAFHVVECRFIQENDNYLMLNGMDDNRKSNVLRLMNLKTTNVTCEPTYGFLPCTTEVWGQLFMIIVYEYLLGVGGHYIATGSNLFFETFGTGILGASLFQMVGTIPQVVMLLANGISGSAETIETTAAMGMGMLAGSAVTVLTLVWGSVVAFGSSDLSRPSPLASDQDSTPTTTTTTTAPSTSSASENKTPFSLTGYGVKTDKETRNTARIMLASMIPFLILQLAKLLGSSSAARVVVLIALIITLVFLITYCVYQVFEPWIQDRRLEYLMLKYVRDNLLQSLLNARGEPDESILRQLFHKIDQDKSSRISTNEVRALILGLQVEELGMNKDDYVEKLMKVFDTSGDKNITEQEFIDGIGKWIEAAKNHDNTHVTDKPKRSTRNSNSTLTGDQQLPLITTEKKESKNSANNNKKKAWLNYIKAGFWLALGMAMMILLAQPLMQSIQEFATAINIPSFMVSYVVIPLAMSFKQLIGAITSAKKKTLKATSLTLSEIYNGVFMNNTMGMATFLALVYIRDLTWDVSAEVLVILIINTVMGLLTSFSTKFPFCTCILAYALYPFSLLLLFVLFNVFGWS